MIWDKNCLYTDYPIGSSMSKKYLCLWNCFFSKINFTNTLDMMEGCWEWTGALNANGYGKIRMLQKDWLAHRLSYTHHEGAIPCDKIVRHMCHNRKCCNPEHLELGDDIDNMLDRCRAGRTPKGDWHCKSKQVLITYGNTVITCDTLTEASECLGVSRQAIVKHLIRYPDGEWKRFGITKMRIVE